MQNNPRCIERFECCHVDEEVYKVPNGITMIDYKAFYQNLSIRKIVLPYSLVKIRLSAFKSCENLEEIQFSKWPFLLRIGSSAFEHCHSLKEVSIPNSVKSIESEAFAACSSLTKVKLPKGLKILDEEVFLRCTALKSITLPSKLKTIKYNAFASCKSLTEINLNKNLKLIENGVFRNCCSLENINLPSSLIGIGSAAFMGCENLKQIKIPDKIVVLSDSMFIGCKSLKEVILPKNLSVIESSAFNNCSALERIEIPAKITKINSYAFADCTSLKDIVLPEGVISLGTSLLRNCTSLEKFTIPSNITLIPDWFFSGCTALKDVKFSKEVENIGYRAFENCTSLTRLEFPANVVVQQEAFKGCENLEEVVFEGPVKSISSNVFLGCGFKYVYKLKGSGKIIYSKEIPTNENEIENIIEVSKIESQIQGFDIGQLATKEGFERYKDVAEKLERSKTYIPFVLIEKLNELNRMDEIGSKLNFKFFNGELPNTKEEIEKKLSGDGIINLYKFALALGCFSTEKMVDKNGNPTNVIRGQKASSFVATLFKNDKLRVYSLSDYFGKMEFGEMFPQEFLNFVTTRADGKNYNNWELLVELENKYPGIILRVARNFSAVESLRVVLDDTGRPQKISWKDALIKLYNRNRYENITDETREMADLFADKGVEEAVFDKAVKIYKKAKQKGVKPHILDIHLREETILETIEKIKTSIDQTLLSSKELIEELYEKKFTFEFLSKYDPHNAIMGIYCSCCGSISSHYYGREVAEASIAEKDVQNLVIRDSNGEIVAKGTMYVSSSGYAVINDIEINDRFKKHESYEDGFYSVDENSPEEQDRELIFKAFMRGVSAFVKQYDMENPKRPIKKVNVGMGYNRLKRQCNRYRQETKLLRVPNDYGFMDAREGQWVLYERGVNQEQGGGQSR